MSSDPSDPLLSRDEFYPVGSLLLRVNGNASSDRPMVFLHGVTRRWQSFLPVEPLLSCRYQLNFVDLRGHGASSRAEGYRVVDYADDIVRFLEVHKKQPVVLYGHSLGAMVAADVAARAPQLVRALVLEDPPFNTMGNRIRQTRLLSYFQGLYELARARLGFEEILRRLPEIRMVDPQTNAVQRVGDVRDAIFLRFTARSLSQMDPAVLAPIVEGTWLEEYDWRDIIARIACPTLILQADPVAGGMLIEEDARWCQQHLREGTLMFYPGAAHLIHWARPVDLANHVQGFLASLDE